MFQSLRPNSQIYVLHRGEHFSVDVGFVTNVSIPRPKYNNQLFPGKLQETVVDITAKLGNVPNNFNNLDAGSDISESFSNGENIVIATNKEALNSWITNLKQTSIDVINSIDVHKNLITEYDRVLKELNPEIAEKELQKTEIQTLKEQVSQMTLNVTALMEANKALIEKLNSK